MPLKKLAYRLPLIRKTQLSLNMFENQKSEDPKKTAKTLIRVHRLHVDQYPLLSNMLQGTFDLVTAKLLGIASYISQESFGDAFGVM